LTTSKNPTSRAAAVDVSFDEFRNEWMQSVRANNPNTVQLGNRFAHKIITQWLDVNPDSYDIIYCDGSGDGGIDAAYLSRKEATDNDADVQTVGDIWYLIQSKYGSAFRGTKTLIDESQKLVDTLDGKRDRLSSLAEGILSRVITFRQSASEQDKIILVFATEDALTEEQSRAIEDIKAMGRNRLGSVFDVEAVSLESIFKRLQDEASDDAGKLQIKLSANLVASGPNLLVGSTPLTDLFDFLKLYRKTTQDLDQLYERNVRRFLGGRGKVNKAMQATLRDSPEKFGLFNNGITITVTAFSPNAGGYDLIEPYVVNGCQTTRTIWEVCQQKLEAGGTGPNATLDEWKKRLGQGVVVTKIVRVGTHGEPLLQEITRYTNTQNAVREKDFLTLTSDFRTWASQMDSQYNVFLEVQRGGWESRRALQKQRHDIKQFEHATNAFDLLKVYGAGWLGEAGSAFGRNTAFLPNGNVFKRIMNGDGESTFGIDDLFAAYRLQTLADAFNFGRSAERPSRRQSRFLFYTTVVELLKDVLVRMNRTADKKAITNALTTVFAPGNEAAAKILLDNAINLIDDYLTAGTDGSVQNEPRFVNDFNGDLNGFLKWEGIGKSEENTPHYRTLIADYRRLMGRALPGGQTDRDVIINAIRATT
jgi:hypothetical protein